jgi:hypothetical protein
MSFDMFVGCFGSDENSGFPRGILERALTGLVDRTEPGVWRLRDSLACLYVDEAPALPGFTISRPPRRNQPFWPALIDVLRQTPCALFWGPGGCVVADASVIPDLPADFIESVGIPTVATEVAKIFEVLENS